MDYSAKLVIHKADKLTKTKALKLSKWLRNLSYFVLDEHDNLSKRFIARYMN